MILIQSKSNEKIKHVSQLLTKKGRDLYSSFLVEGERAILQAIDNECIIDILLISKKKQLDNDYLSIASKCVETYLVEDKLFVEISDTDNSQGIMAIVKKPIFSFNCIIDKSWENILLLDRIQDPGNLGTIIRTAEAVGYDCILVSKGSTDPFSPKVTRATVGANTSIPIIFTSEDEVLKLKHEGYRLIVTTLGVDSKNYKNVSYDGKHIVVMGNEANGVSDFFIENADEKVIIPIYGKTESLNVAIATAIILYESK